MAALPNFRWREGSGEMGQEFDYLLSSSRRGWGNPHPKAGHVSVVDVRGTIGLHSAPMVWLCLCVVPFRERDQLGLGSTFHLQHLPCGLFLPLVQEHLGGPALG